MSEHSGAKITVRITDASCPQSLDYVASTAIDLYTCRELMQELDHPLPDSHPLVAMMCTDQATIKRVKILRKDYAKLITQAIMDILLDAFEKNDTVCGFAKEK